MRARAASRWRLSRGVALLAAALVAGVAISAGSAGTGTTKPYTAVFGSSVAGGAANADVTLTLHNLSSNQSLGSANVTAASNATGAFTITGETGAPVAAGQTYPTGLLMLRNLNLAPGGSLTVHISVQTPCAGGTYAWGIRGQTTTSTGRRKRLHAGPARASRRRFERLPPRVLDQPSNALSTRSSRTRASIERHRGAGSQYVRWRWSQRRQPIASATGTVTLSEGRRYRGSFAPPTRPPFDSHGITTFDPQEQCDRRQPSTQRTAPGSPTPIRAAAFSITNGGEDCLGQPACSFSTPLTNAQVDTTGTGDFNFIAITDTTTIPASVTAAGGGCEHFIGTGTGFAEFDSRNANGSLDFTYSIPDRLLKRAYGPNYGQPNVPLCAGGKVVVNNQPIDCDPATQTPWMGRHLGMDGRFDGTYRAAVCGADGFWWGVLGTRQDPNPPIDPAVTPRITGWGTSPDGLSRTFTIHVTPGWDWRNY